MKKYKIEYMEKGGTIGSICFIIGSVKIYNFLFYNMHYTSSLIMLICTLSIIIMYFISFIIGWIKDRHEERKRIMKEQYKDNIKLLEDTEW